MDQIRIVCPQSRQEGRVVPADRDDQSALDAGGIEDLLGLLGPSQEICYIGRTAGRGSGSEIGHEESVGMAGQQCPVGTGPRMDQGFFKKGRAEGVTVLEGTLVSRETGDWNGKLYREFKRSESSRFSGKLIPYFVWSNRGPSEMTVWLPHD